MLGGVGAFLLKPDSALGRLFLWKITCRAIVSYPSGCDKGFAFAYGEAQEDYFAQGDYAEWEERVAGSPEYVFNEYLSLALKEGVAVCVTVLVVIGTCLWMGRSVDAMVSAAQFWLYLFSLFLPILCIFRLLW